MEIVCIVLPLLTSAWDCTFLSIPVLYFRTFPTVFFQLPRVFHCFIGSHPDVVFSVPNRLGSPMERVRFLGYQFQITWKSCTLSVSLRIPILSKNSIGQFPRTLDSALSLSWSNIIRLRFLFFRLHVVGWKCLRMPLPSFNIRLSAFPSSIGFPVSIFSLLRKVEIRFPLRILQSLLAYPNAFLFVFAFGFPFSFPYLLLTFRLPDTPLYPNSISALRLSKVDLLSRLPSHGSLEHMLLGFSALPSVRKIRFAYFVRFVPSFLFTRWKRTFRTLATFRPASFSKRLRFSDLPVEHLPIFSKASCATIFVASNCHRCLTQCFDLTVFRFARYSIVSIQQQPQRGYCFNWPIGCSPMGLAPFFPRHRFYSIFWLSRILKSSRTPFRCTFFTFRLFLFKI